MKPVQPPWEAGGLSDEQKQVLFRDLGYFYLYKEQFELGQKYHDKSLELKSDDARALLFRSKCKRELTKAESALEDGMRAASLVENNVPADYEVCYALYESNRLEQDKLELHNNARKYSKHSSLKKFRQNIGVVNENFKDSVGPTLGPFILKNEKIFPRVLEDLKRKNHVDRRPLWKILKEQDKCDVLSIQDKEEVLLSPLEVARRDRSFKVTHQLYMKRAWIDVMFLKHLRQNPNMLLPQTKGSTPFLKHFTCSKYDVVQKFIKMLQTRSPLYNENLRRFSDRKVYKKQREDYLMRVQYQTRRNMMAILRNIRILREKGQVEKLSRYVEEVMGDYVVLKTQRVMPWKFEFITEVYNTLALAYADLYRQPLKSHELYLARLLKLPSSKHYEPPDKWEFGNRATYNDMHVETSLTRYKYSIDRLEKRMHFAKFGIERCYLLHEIARCHLMKGRFEECRLYAKKAVDEAHHHGFNLWQFLSTMLIVKCRAQVQKVELLKEALDQAHVLAVALKSPELKAFIETCSAVNDRELYLKKRTRSAESIRSRQRGRSPKDSGESSRHSTETIRTLGPEEAEENEECEEHEEYVSTTTTS